MSDDPVVRMTSPMLKAMTHPLRRRIIALMTPELPMRAVDLAEQLGVPANTVSFHLRKLAEAGMLVEAPEHARDRRDRVWVAAGGGFGLPTPQEPLVAEDEVALRAYADQAYRDIDDLLRRVVAWAADWSTGRDPEPRAELNVGTAELTPQDAATIVEELNGVLAHAKELTRASAGQPGRRSYDLVVMLAESDLGRHG